LPDPAAIALTDSSSYVAPRDDVEATLAHAWAELLGVERVGVEDDFFGLGGHSLLAVLAIARVHSDFGVQLPLHSLFLAPTVASLAQLVRDERVAAAGGDDELERMLGELEGLSDEDVDALLRDAPDGA
jgi:acyl carrier protein